MKTSELSGPALDWVVAKLIGKAPIISDHCGDKAIFVCTALGPLARYSPSTNWSQGGPIIEREGLAWNPQINGQCIAFKAASSHTYSIVPSLQYGPTPLIAAMRCYVASKLGDEVDIPKELK